NNNNNNNNRSHAMQYAVIYWPVQVALKLNVLEHCDENGQNMPLVTVKTELVPSGNVMVEYSPSEEIVSNDLHSSDTRFNSILSKLFSSPNPQQGEHNTISGCSNSSIAPASQKIRSHIWKTSQTITSKGLCLKDIFNVRHLFISFVEHVVSVENLLFLVDTLQYKQNLIHRWYAFFFVILPLLLFLSIIYTYMYVYVYMYIYMYIYMYMCVCVNSANVLSEEEKKLPLILPSHIEKDFIGVTCQSNVKLQSKLLYLKYIHGIRLLLLLFFFINPKLCSFVRMQKKKKERSPFAINISFTQRKDLDTWYASTFKGCVADEDIKNFSHFLADM
ncbi:hypothetical protein RFI_26942, partial [Reticulomyxa filosa]